MTYKTRPYFRETSFKVPHYYVYQPIVKEIAPWFHDHDIPPTLITMTRFISLTIMGILLITAYQRPACKWFVYPLIIATIFIAAVSDDLDGYVARRYNQKSKSGAVFDGLADWYGILVVMGIFSVKFGIKASVVLLLSFLLCENFVFTPNRVALRFGKTITHEWTMLIIIMTIFIVFI